jgi:hypothetical protein
MATKNVMKRLWRTKHSGPVLRIFPLKGKCSTRFFLQFYGFPSGTLVSRIFFDFSTRTEYNSCTVSSVRTGPIDRERFRRISQNIPARNYPRRLIGFKQNNP